MTSSPAGGPSVIPTQTSPQQRVVAEQLAPTLIGLDIAAAKALAQEHDVRLRVRGEGPALWTWNRMPNRINVAVEQGRVVSAEALLNSGTLISA